MTEGINCEIGQCQPSAENTLFLFEVNMNKCEWVDGKFEPCEGLYNAVFIVGTTYNLVDGENESRWQAVYENIIYKNSECPYCHANINMPEPEKPLIVKSGDTWVKYENGIDYLWMTLCYSPHECKNGDDFGTWMSFSEIKLTDKIALFRPIVYGWNMVKDANICTYKLLAVVQGTSYKYIGQGYSLEACRLATAKELLNDNT